MKKIAFILIFLLSLTIKAQFNQDAPWMEAINDKKAKSAKPVTFKEIVDALNNLDLPVIMGSVIIIATMFVMINILVDLIYRWLDPKIRIK